MLHKADGADDADVKPADQHREAEAAAAVAAALANIRFSRWGQLVPKTREALEQIGAETARKTLESLDAPLEGNPAEAVTAWVGDYARNRAAELVGRKWIGDQLVADGDAEKAITVSTVAMIRDAVADGLAERKGHNALTQAIAETPAFTAGRAARIAKYEISSLFNAVRLKAFEAGGVEFIRWRTVGDDLVEEVCQLNEDAGPIPVGTLFPSGHAAPLAHAGCRCVLEVADDAAGKVAFLERLAKGDHVKPENAVEVALPLADPVTEADVQHEAWEIAREAMQRGRAVRSERRTVPMSLLWATQAVVDRERVARDARAYEEHGQGEDELPLVIQRDDDDDERFYILSGHHHASAAALEGAQELDVQVMTGVE